MVFGGIKHLLGIESSMQSCADVMLCADDSASFFLSPLALCVSLILSLRNLMDAISATLLAPLWELGAELVLLWEQRRF